MSAEAYTLEEAAVILDCEPETAAERIANGDLPGVKFGRSWILPRDAFSQRLNEIALEESARRRNERQARGTAGNVISAAKGKAPRARVAPTLPAQS